MQTPEQPNDSKPASPATAPKSGTQPVELIELGLGLDLLLETHPVFADAVKAAILPLDGEFLFELPHGDKPGGKGRVAVVRLTYAGSGPQKLAFVFLSADSLETRVEAAEGQPEHLTNFARSFVDVLEKIGQH